MHIIMVHPPIWPLRTEQELQPSLYLRGQNVDQNDKVQLKGGGRGVTKGLCARAATIV
jgi:hypothetical protein